MGGPTTRADELRTYQGPMALCSPNQKSRLTREGLVQKEINLCAELRCIHALQFVNLHASWHFSAAGRKKGERNGGRRQVRTALTFFPSKKNPKVGVALTLYSRATIEAKPTPRSTLANAIRPRPRPFSRASSENTGSIIRHGGHVADVNMATTARCEPSSARNDAGSVGAWSVPSCGPAARALVEGEGEL